MEKKLTVKNLKISFRTDGGKVQAVRNIDFDLYKGETLAIVGESGSGKSVTSRAVLGILAPNAIKENGEILYDGQDLMKISEKEFCKIRGDKIAMIFQDPLSSLNPIMRIGKQMTEAMLIKGRKSRKESRKDFNETLKLLNLAMNAAVGVDNAEECAENKRKCGDFDKFEYKHLELENAFTAAKEAAIEALSNIDDVLFHIEKNATTRLREEIVELIKFADRTYDRYVVCARADELKAELDGLRALVKVEFKDAIKNAVVPVFVKNAKIVDKTDYAAVALSLGKIKEILAEAVAFDEPNFFSLGYYLTFESEQPPEMSVAEMNKFTRKILDDNFMLNFIECEKQGVIYSHNRSIENKKAAVSIIDAESATFEKPFDRKAAKESAKRIADAVEKSIDKLDTVKDNIAYTFRSSIKSSIEGYFDGVKRNAKEERRYARQMASYDKKVAAGKNPDYKVADKNLVDLDAVRTDILSVIGRIKARCENSIENANNVDFDARSVAVIDYLKEKASGVAHKVTHDMAKNRALKLLEEVGIPEPRKRYSQYPFEFSGGMRQRIVIAIALSADPDILICDEPTTALDVTIQSQILELINKVKAERNLSVIFITHDLGVVANMADRVAVMYAGKIVEIGTANDVFYAPAHPYTWALLSSMPDLDTKEKLEAIPGTPPNMIYPPKGDAFADRNKYAMQIDFEAQPPMFKISDTHYAATWLLHPNAPKIDPPKAVTDRINRMRNMADGKTAVEAEEAAADGESVEAVAPTEKPKKAATKKPAAEKKPTAKKSTATAKKESGEKKSTAAKSDDGKKSAAKKPASKKTAKKDGGEK